MTLLKAQWVVTENFRPEGIVHSIIGHDRILGIGSGANKTHPEHGLAGRGATLYYQNLADVRKSRTHDKKKLVAASDIELNKFNQTVLCRIRKILKR